MADLVAAVAHWPTTYKSDVHLASHTEVQVIQLTTLEKNKQDVLLELRFYSLPPIKVAHCRSAFGNPDLLIDWIFATGGVHHRITI